MQPTSIKIIKQLKSAGFVAYWAGGCVRDMLLGIKPKDFDIATSALPDQIEKILKKTIPIGRKFGVMLAIENGHHFEIATFRSDSGYSDGRRPDAVIFTTAKEDALRRDFTINGMFYDPLEDKIIDFVDGQKDLDARLIWFIGDPTKRILEDHLRILRAIRFKNQLGFQYEPKTYQAISSHAKLVIDKVSNERIGAEINKMLMSDNVVGSFEDMEDTGVLQIIMPELRNLKGCGQPIKYHKEGDVWQHTMQALKSLPKTAELPIRWAVLLHDIGKPDTFKLKERIRFDGHVTRSKEIAQKILTRLKFPRRMVNEVCWLVNHHMIMVQLVEMSEGRKRHWFLHPYFLNLMQLFKADAIGITPTDLSLYNKILALYRGAMKEMPVEPKPLLSGNEIMDKLELEPGEKVGKILSKLRESQLAGELKTKEDAVKWIKKNQF